MILNLQPGNLDRVVERHVLQKLERNSVRRVLETAVTLAVSDYVGRGFLADWQSRGTPQRPTVLVTNVDHFTGPVANGIVGPGAELILLTVDRPRIACAVGRYLEAEGGIGDDVDPGRWSPLPLAEDRHVFPSAGREAAEAIEKLELGPGQRGRRNFIGRRTSGRRPADGVGSLQALDLLEQAPTAAEQHRSRDALEQAARPVR